MEKKRIIQLRTNPFPINRDWANKSDTTASESAPVGEKQNKEFQRKKANRRESLIAKEKQIDELVGDAESYKNDLEKLEEEAISEDQIAQRMKELESES